MTDKSKEKWKKEEGKYKSWRAHPFPLLVPREEEISPSLSERCLPYQRRGI
jgi:hypothetical protein